jgi:hypothetical protein
VQLKKKWYLLLNELHCMLLSISFCLHELLPVVHTYVCVCVCVCVCIIHTSIYTKVVHTFMCMYSIYTHTQRERESERERERERGREGGREGGRERPGTRQARQLAKREMRSRPPAPPFRATNTTKSKRRRKAEQGIQ